jgi:Uma2 family endonuclease
MNPNLSMPEIIYPESDGLPMADNSVQTRFMNILYSNLSAQYRHDPNVWVGSNLFWYPVEFDNKLRQAPDVLVVFGRPKHERTSYRQWEETDSPLTVVVEILSPSNEAWEMIDKHDFYDRFGVEEYYICDPANTQFKIYLRVQQELCPIRVQDTFISPRLGIRFDLTGQDLDIYRPDGRRMLPSKIEHVTNL